MKHVKCNICGSGKTRHLYTISGLNIVKCAKCGLAYVNPRYTEAELSKIYQKSYFSNPGFYEDAESKKLKHFGYSNYFHDKKNIQANFMPRLKRIKSINGIGKILDFGCAYGFFLDLAKKNGFDCYGVDISGEAIRKAKSMFKGISFFSYPYKAGTFKKGFFDVITLFDVIEHLPDPAAEIRELSSLMKKGGLLVITTPDIGSLFAMILGKNWEEIKRVREHIFFFSGRTLSRLLKKEGFAIKRIETTGRLFRLEDSLRFASLSIRFFGHIYRLVKGTWLGRLNVRINPGYKMTVYAVKI